MATLVDGKLTDAVPCHDRGLAYGDGLFETLALIEGSPRHLPRHLKRLADGASRLGIDAPRDARWMEDLARLVAACNPPPRAVLKMILTRGSGGRGYTPPEPASPRRILQILPWPTPSPESGRIGIICKTRLAINPLLAGLKHLNRLEQVLAAREVAAAGAWEGLMFDTGDQLIEGTRSNVFIVVDGKIETPRLDGAGVSGVMHAILCEQAPGWGMPVAHRVIDPARLELAEEIFFTNSLRGIESLHRLAIAGRERAFSTRLADALRARLMAEGLWQ